MVSNAPHHIRASGRPRTWCCRVGDEAEAGRFGRHGTSPGLQPKERAQRPRERSAFAAMDQLVERATGASPRGGRRSYGQKKPKEPAAQPEGRRGGKRGPKDAPGSNRRVRGEGRPAGQPRLGGPRGGEERSSRLTGSATRQARFIWFGQGGGGQPKESLAQPKELG